MSGKSFVDDVFLTLCHRLRHAVRDGQDERAKRLLAATETLEAEFPEELAWAREAAPPEKKP